jgi:hypothetical protein
MIADIARELKRPVPLDPGLGDRVMAEIRAPAAAASRKWIGWAIAAGLAGLAFYFGWNRGADSTDQGVSFSLDAPTASRVSLVGDFNNWDPAATPLARVAGGGRWEAVVPLTPGRYQFTFVVDGSRWVRDPGSPQAMGDDFGQPTSVITVVGHGRS